jgi:glutamine amidotransferase
MTDRRAIAIVDFGMGNLFSVAQACRTVGLGPVITDDPKVVETADGVIVPGVGAFGDAMSVLRSRGLVEALHRVAESGKPLFGICLGMQLFMNESEEFGRHAGLGLIGGSVRKLPAEHNGSRVKVPQVGWNHVSPVRPGAWVGSVLEGVAPDTYAYFVHSYYVAPADERVVLGLTTYGGLRYCSALGSDNVHAFQFHPEKSGDEGLAIYRNMAKLVQQVAPAPELPR